MATFAELVADVRTITNRPDLDSEIRFAVKAATLKAHHIDFFPKDLYEVGIQWNPADFFQSLDYRALVPRWRAIKYLRKYDNVGSTAGDFFSILLPEQVVDGYGISRDDVCYLAGSELEIRSSTEDDYMLLGCYIHPDLNEATYSSWIALDHPYAIVYEAASKIFKMIGFDEKSSQFNKEVMEQFTQVRNSNILAQGY